MQKMLALLGAKSKEEFVALLAQFIKFGLVGVSNTAVSMAVYYIFLWIVNLLVTIPLNFIINKLWTFKER